MDIPIETVSPEQRRPRPADDQLGFGQVFTDHMFVMEYEAGRGWHDPRVVPYGPLPLDPAAVVLHYGQAVFEGMKAFAGTEGRIVLFRPDAHARRFGQAAARLCVPALAPEMMLAGIEALIRVDRDWVPESPGTALYVRPTLIATEPTLSVRAAARYLFYVILSPVGSYYGGGGITPVKIWVEDEYVRAARGGVGAVKTGANYAASLLATERARADGFAQVLWLDAGGQRRLEEVGTMNLFVRIGDEVITPPLGGTILPGITRDSALTLLRDWGVPASERDLTLDELLAANRAGTLREVFGTGTAAVITPVGELAGRDVSLTLRDGGIGEVSQRLYDTITGIQRGTAPDPHGWLRAV